MRMTRNVAIGAAVVFVTLCLGIAANEIFTVDAEAGREEGECVRPPASFGYEVVVGPYSESLDLLAVIHSGAPFYEYISGPVRLPAAGPGCYGVFYRYSGGENVQR